MGTRPVLFAVETACLYGAGNRSKQHPRKNGAAHYAREHGRLQTVDWANVYRGADEPERNGREGRRHARPRTRETAEGAGGRPPCGARSGEAERPLGAADQRSALPIATVGCAADQRSALPPRWAVTSSWARSSSPSAGLQGADGTRSRCPRPDHLRSGWPSRDPVPDGSFHGHGSGC